MKTFQNIRMPEFGKKAVFFGMVVYVMSCVFLCVGAIALFSHAKKMKIEYQKLVQDHSEFDLFMAGSSTKGKKASVEKGADNVAKIVQVLGLKDKVRNMRPMDDGVELSLEAVTQNEWIQLLNDIQKDGMFGIETMRMDAKTEHPLTIVIKLVVI